MDFNNIREQVSNLTLYDLKAGVRKVQNAVMNFTEMESKVREATNNEPWGASSSLMQEIANGTYSYQLLNEIMPMIYRRFTEKAAEEWRQIYKALQLLEFLIKNGSEKVIDDARSHLSLLKMLRQFHFIDQNGKDQGINVRNRSKELAELLSDVDRIRAERKKARITRNKYGGIEGGSSGIAGGIKGGRYGGFGSESGGYGGYSGGVYGDGGGFGGQSTNNEEEQSGKSGQRTDRFEEYDEYDEGEVASPRNRKTRPTGPPIPSKADLPTSSARKPQPAKAKQPEIDILSFGDDDGPKQTPVKPSFASAADKSAGFGSLQSAGEEDEFGDFTSASPTTSNGANSIGTALFPLTSSGPTPLPKPNYNSLNIPISQPTLAPALQSSTSNPISAHQLKSTSSQAKYQVPAPNYFTSVPVPSVPPTQAKPDSSAFASVTKTSSIPAVQKSNKPAGGDAFGSLWSAVSTSSGRSTPKPTGAGPSMADLAKQKSSQGIWGAASSSTTTNGGATNTLGSQPASNGLDDLLL